MIPGVVIGCDGTECVFARHDGRNRSLVTGETTKPSPATTQERKRERKGGRRGEGGEERAVHWVGRRHANRLQDVVALLPGRQTLDLVVTVAGGLAGNRLDRLVDHQAGRDLRGQRKKKENVIERRKKNIKKNQKTITIRHQSDKQSHTRSPSPPPPCACNLLFRKTHRVRRWWWRWRE